MDYLAIIKKKEEEELRHIYEEAKEVMRERVQGEISELSERSPELNDGGDAYPVVMDGLARKRQDEKNEKSQASDVAIEPAAVNAKPIYWERMSTGRILGPAQPEFLAKVGSGLQVSYWVVVTYQGEPSWINADSLRSKRQFEAQARPMLLPVTPIIQASAVTPKPDAIEQPALEFSDGR